MPDVRILDLPRERAALDRFLDVPARIYQDDPHWVPAIRSDLRKVLGDANPFLAHARMALWVARRDGQDVGRIAGIVDAHHNVRHGEATAFFGYFEAIDDLEVSRALFATVRAWARDRGMTRLLGPLNPSLNEECGLLVDGFAAAPVVMMTYNPAYYLRLYEDAGLRCARRLLAFLITLDRGLLTRFERVAARALGRIPGLRVRPIRKRRLRQELGKIQEVYNAAWEDNWAHVPMTAAEVEFMARRLVPLLREDLVLVAETPEEPVAFILGLPDYNEAFHRLRGRLLSPRLVLALPYLAGLRRPRLLRVMAFGVKRGYRQRGVEAALFAGILRAAADAGFEGAELSWILEENVATRRMAELFGGRVYKSYAVYEGAA